MLHFDPENPPGEGHSEIDDFERGRTLDRFELPKAVFVCRGDQEIFVVGVSVAKEILEDAYGAPEDLAKFVAGGPHAELVQGITARIREIRGQ